LNGLSGSRVGFASFAAFAAAMSSSLAPGGTLMNPDKSRNARRLEVSTAFSARRSLPKSMEAVPARSLLPTFPLKSR
jgi:hypothetical protein